MASKKKTVSKKKVNRMQKKPPVTLANTDPLTKMGNKDWYNRLEELRAQLDEEQHQQAKEFLLWSNDPQGPIPEAKNVDALQLAFSQHMLVAPKDEPDDEVEDSIRAERFAEAHRDGMGPQSGYSQANRHAQTKEYHDSLSEDSEFLMNESRVANLPMSRSQNPVLPRYNNRNRKATMEQDRMIAALASYREANTDEDFTLGADDYKRLLGLDPVGSGKIDQHPGLPTVANSVEAKPTEDAEMLE